jgi:asparagine synthase (glutamine-hydrolysing)
MGRTLAKELGSRRARAMAAALGDPWASYRDHLFHFTPGEARELISADVDLVDPGAAVSRLDQAWGRAERNGRGWVPWVDSLTYLPDDLLTKMDRATMAFGIESRAPLLDQELWSFVAGVPRSWLLGRRRGKLLLRDAYAGVLPEQILARTKKGFGVPIAQWMRSYLRDPLGDLLLSSAHPVGGLLDPSPVRKIVDRFLRGDDGMTNRTWNLLALAGWCEARSGVLGRG